MRTADAELIMQPASAETAVSSQAVMASLRQHGIGFTADNYAVWHCYMAGTNVALRRAIDVVLSNGLAIEERVLRVLYARYFAMRGRRWRCGTWRSAACVRWRS